MYIPHFVYPSMDVWVVSTFWLLWIMLLWTLVYKYLCESLLSILLCIHRSILGVELLDYMVTFLFNFWGTTKLFSKTATPFYILTSNAWWFQLWFICFFCLFVCLFWHLIGREPLCTAQILCQLEFPCWHIIYPLIHSAKIYQIPVRC